MSLSILATTTTTTVPSAFSTRNNPLRRTNKTLVQQPPVHVGKRVACISCERRQSNNKDGIIPSAVNDKSNGSSIDRRNVLLGLGGMYGATATTLGNPSGMSAMGAPTVPPDLTQCHQATDLNTGEPTTINCCPPSAYTTKPIVDFTPPSLDEPLRVRKPAHLWTPWEIERFEAAILEMKLITKKDKDHPWGYHQQATIHCTYCNEVYDQLGTDIPLQIHMSWLFLPWHRYYIYFWERILGKLINDPTFAIPFWNWDTPGGMYMPKMYLNEKSPLYDDKRNHAHYDSIIDYGFKHQDSVPTTPEQIDKVTFTNLCRINRIFREAKFRPSLFMGKPVPVGRGAKKLGAGSCEHLHNIMHTWSGEPDLPNYDMGNFVTAARDTLFFGHHGNVDRMWDLYSKSRGGTTEFRGRSDWNQSEFIFYDENNQVVKVKVKDCLTPEQLRYTYEPEPLPWKDIGPKCLSFRIKNKKSGDSVKLGPVSEFGSQPRALTETIRAIVKRPKTNRSKAEKEQAAEVLTVKGIHVNSAPASFDVFVTNGLVGLDHGELAGSYVKVPHGHHGSSSSHSAHKEDMELGVTFLLEDIEAESSETVVVTLVPRHGDVTVEGIDIELLNNDDEN